MPQGFGLAPSLKLQTPPKAEPAPRDDEDPKFDYERPKGRLCLYRGCGASVREEQPKVPDLATATPQELGQFFQARRVATIRCRSPGEADYLPMRVITHVRGRVGATGMSPA